MAANTRTEANGKPTLRFDVDRFEEVWRVVHGPMSVKQTAERLGLDYAHWSQIRTGRRRPGPETIAAVVMALPKVPFDELFPVETGDAA